MLIGITPVSNNRYNNISFKSENTPNDTAEALKNDLGAFEETLTNKDVPPVVSKAYNMVKPLAVGAIAGVAVYTSLCMVGNAAGKFCTKMNSNGFVNSITTTLKNGIVKAARKQYHNLRPNLEKFTQTKLFKKFADTKLGKKMCPDTSEFINKIVNNAKKAKDALKNTTLKSIGDSIARVLGFGTGATQATAEIFSIKPQDAEKTNDKKDATNNNDQEAA